MSPHSQGGSRDVTALAFPSLQRLDDRILGGGTLGWLNVGSSGWEWELPLFLLALCDEGPQPLVGIGFP